MDGKRYICSTCHYAGHFAESRIDLVVLKKLQMIHSCGVIKNLVRMIERYPTDYQFDEKLIVVHKPLKALPPPPSIKIAKDKNKETEFDSLLKSFKNAKVNHWIRRINCRHNKCYRIVRPVALVDHFENEHKDVGFYTNVRRETLQFICSNLSEIEFNKTTCLGMIKLYECSVIGASQASTPGVKNVCNQMSQFIPVNMFWLMLSTSSTLTTSEQHPLTFYVIFWLLSQSNDLYQCRLEVMPATKKHSSMLLSTFCNAVLLHDSMDAEAIVDKTNCLLLSRNTCLALIAASDEFVLKVTVL